MDTVKPMSDLLGANADDVREVMMLVEHDELRRNLSPEVTTKVLDELFARFPDYLDPERTRGVHETFGWDVEGRRWVVSIDDGKATVTKGPGTARVTLKLDTVDLLGLVTGTNDPAVLFFTGRLRLTGDDAFVLELAKYFRAPTHSGEVDPTAVNVSHMIEVIGAVPEVELRERLKGGLRDTVLAQVFARFPDYIHLDRTQDMQAVMKWTLTGRADGEADRWFVEIDRGTCRTGQALDLDPRVTIRIDAADFLKLVTGNSNPTLAFLRGKLKVKGDLGFAAQLPKLFRIPSA